MVEKFKKSIKVEGGKKIKINKLDFTFISEMRVPSFEMGACDFIPSESTMNIVSILRKDAIFPLHVLSVFLFLEETDLFMH